MFTMLNSGNSDRHTVEMPKSNITLNANAICDRDYTKLRETDNKEGTIANIAHAQCNTTQDTMRQSYVPQFTV